MNRKLTIPAFALLFLTFGLSPASGALISYWALDGDAMDSGPGGNNGTAVGATFAAGQVGQAASFDGTNDYITFGDTNALDNAPFISIALWFNRAADNASATNHGVNNVLFANSSDSSNDNLEIGTDGGNVEIYVDSVGGDGPNPLVTAQGIANDTWTHLVLTYDSNNPAAELELYIDGVSVFSNGATNNGTLDGAGSSPTSLGVARAGGSNWGDFTGLIDEVYVYDHVLSASEVRALYAVPETGHSALLLGFALVALARRKLARKRG